MLLLLCYNIYVSITITCLFNNLAPESSTIEDVINTGIYIYIYIGLYYIDYIRNQIATKLKSLYLLSLINIL